MWTTQPRKTDFRCSPEWARNRTAGCVTWSRAGRWKVRDFRTSRKAAKTAVASVLDAGAAATGMARR